MDILKEISKTKLVVLVTHEVTLIKKYADTYIKLVDGLLVDNAEIDEAEFANITYGNVEEKPVSANELKGFTKSPSDKNGRLYTFKNIFRTIKKGNDEKGYSGGNVFKQIFIVAMAVVVCFFSMFAFEALNVKTVGKPIDDNSVYVGMNNYSEVRKLKGELYDTVDFYEMNYAEGSFSYNNLQSLSGITAAYAPKALKTEDTAESVGLEFGSMPQEKQVLVSRGLAETLKNKLRIDKLKNDRSISLILFEKDYAVSGIVNGDKPFVYFNRADYVNFLGVYKEIRFTDNTDLFFDADLVDKETYKTVNSYSAEICVYDSEKLDLQNNQCVVEINRNTIYKMMSDTTQADYRMEIANATLLKSPEFISISDSYPMYVRQFSLTRTVMTTDIRIYVTKAALENIFVYISPNLDALGSAAQYFFEISTDGGEQLASLNQRLSDRSVVSTDIGALQKQQGKEELDAAKQSLMIFVLIAITICPPNLPQMSTLT